MIAARSALNPSVSALLRNYREAPRRTLHVAVGKSGQTIVAQRFMLEAMSM